MSGRIERNTWANLAGAAHLVAGVAWVALALVIGHAIYGVWTSYKVNLAAGRTSPAMEEVVAGDITGLALGPNAINRQSPEGKTPLHAAAANLDSEMVQALLRMGADATARDAYGRTALDYAMARVSQAQDLAALERVHRVVRQLEPLRHLPPGQASEPLRK